MESRVRNASKAVHRTAEQKARTCYATLFRICDIFVGCTMVPATSKFSTVGLSLTPRLLAILSRSGLELEDVRVSASSESQRVIVIALPLFRSANR